MLIDELRILAMLQPAASLSLSPSPPITFWGIIIQQSLLYPALAQRVTNAEALRILLSIGPTETSHFMVWHDKAGSSRSPTPLTG
jgi:hypothetical protein